MYRITYTQGNGYHCGCCRRTRTCTHDCATHEEVVSWLSELEAQKQLKTYDEACASDRSVDEIREIKDEAITWEFSPDPVQVSALLEQWNKEEAEKKAREEAEQEDRNRDLFRSLKAAYEKDPRILQPGLAQR